MDESDVAQEAFIEDGVDHGGVILAALGKTADLCSIGWGVHGFILLETYLRTRRRPGFETGRYHFYED